VLNDLKEQVQATMAGDTDAYTVDELASLLHSTHEQARLQRSRRGMRAGHRTVLKLIGTALLSGAILLGTVAPGAGPTAPPHWTLLVAAAVAFVLLWLAVWWHDGSRTNPPDHRGYPPRQQPPARDQAGRNTRSPGSGDRN
jgi:hypothetical protein